MFSYVVVYLLFMKMYTTAKGDLIQIKEDWLRSMEEAHSWARPTANMDFFGFNEEIIDFGDFDFVVVGGGSSGAAIASRLSEVEDWSVLLIEAGGEEPEFSKIPAAIFPTVLSDLNWGYVTTPQLHACFGMKNNQCDFSKGKVLGGSSSINAMMYVRGNERDFEDWGSDKWSFKKVLPYYLKLENASGLSEHVKVDEKYRGTTGPVTTSHPQPLPKLLDAVMSAHEELGDSPIDVNGKEQIGISIVESTISNGRRLSTNSAYLTANVRSRPNLAIFSRTLATKIISDTGIVSNLLFLKDGARGSVRVNKELIISAGSVNSPQLLMLSGIGPRRELARHKIKLEADLPVGRNLEDHVGLIALPVLTNLPSNPLVLDDLLEEYVNGTGQLSYPIADFVRFVSVNEPKNESYPDLEFFYHPLRSSVELFNKLCNYKEEKPKDVTKLPLLYTFHQMLLHPKSRGEITLKSSSPLEHPLINPNYLSNEYDINTLYKGIVEFEKLLETSAMKKISAKIVKPQIKECDEAKSAKDNWYCVLRHKVIGVWHPVGTCKMGKDPEISVVNENLFVHGFKNLRVADASIVPVSPSGHTNAVAIMVGEKVSDVIKEYHLKNFNGREEL